MSDVNSVVERYFTMWNEADPDRRRALIAKTFTEDASYLGPLIGGEGHAGIETMANQLKEHLAGHEFVRIGEIDAHHDCVRFSWEILPPNGQPRFAAGTDYGVVDSDGRLRSVTVFLDQAPDLDEAHHAAEMTA